MHLLWCRLCSFVCVPAARPFGVRGSVRWPLWVVEQQRRTASDRRARVTRPRPAEAAERGTSSRSIPSVPGRQKTTRVVTHKPDSDRRDPQRPGGREPPGLRYAREPPRTSTKSSAVGSALLSRNPKTKRPRRVLLAPAPALQHRRNRLRCRVGGRRPCRAAWPTSAGFLPPPLRTVRAVLPHTAPRRSSPSVFGSSRATACWVVAGRRSR
jgi:hypothetical protein